MTFKRLGRILIVGPIAALVVAAAFTLFTGSVPVAMIGYFYAVFFGVSVGLPLFIITHIRFPVTRASNAIIGFITGAVSIGISTWPLQWQDLKTNQAVNHMPTVINGIPTLLGWLYFAKGLLLFGALGAMAGIVFFYMLKKIGDPLTPGLVAE